MNRVQKSLIAAATAATLGAGALGIGTAFAADNADRSGHPFDGIAAAIAAKFNLNVTDVQAVFEEEHAKMEAAHQAETENRLSDAVTNGKLTQAQADAIKAKQTEMEALMETLKDKTPEEREAAMKAQADDMKSWMETNDIPRNFLQFGFAIGGRHGGPGGPGEHGMFMKEFNAPMNAEEINN